MAGIFSSGRSEVFLSLVWGHIPKGVIRCARTLCKTPDEYPGFKLARGPDTGKPAVTLFHSLGNCHISSSQGPTPVSVMETRTVAHPSISPRDALILHAISIGFPVVGEQKYLHLEKFFNPVFQPPDSEEEIMLTLWFDVTGFEIEGALEKVTRLIADNPFDHTRPRSLLADTRQYTDLSEFSGESSACRFIDHPESRIVRNDRGKPFP
jgi:hypothetical protein